MATIVTLPADAPTRDIVDVLNRDGAVVLQDVLSDELREGIRAELRPHFEATETEGNRKFGDFILSGLCLSGKGHGLPRIATAYVAVWLSFVGAGKTGGGGVS